MGMSGEEIEQLFPWSRSAAGEDDLRLPGDVTVPRDDHWWHRGYESTKAAATRVAEVVTWLERDLREEANALELRPSWRHPSHAACQAYS